MREEYEEEFETFILDVMIQELRIEQGSTQQELAEKCSTTKNYISQIENNASDIRLSTLMRIVREGLSSLPVACTTISCKLVAGG